MKIEFYPDGDTGPVREYLDRLRLNPHRRNACARIVADLAILESEGLLSRQVTIRRVIGIKGSVWELKRRYENIQYRIYFCIKKNTIWLLHFLEKKTGKIPKSDLKRISRRAREVMK